MRRKLGFIVLLALIGLLVSACATGLEPGNGTASTAEAAPATEAASSTEAVSATEVVVTEAQTEATAAPAETEIVQPTPAEGERVPPQEPMVPEDKPSLDFTSSMEPLANPIITPVIGFVFPDGTVALKAAAFEEVQLDKDDQYYEVGAVEIGSDPPQAYKVAIDLPAEEEVQGQLVSVESGEIINLSFTSTNLVLNEKREPLLPVYVGITSDSVCFVVDLNYAGIQYPPDQAGFRQYCSQPGSPLSVRADFPQQYEQLIGEVATTVDILVGGGYLQVDPSQVLAQISVSEAEDPANIDACSGDNCAADVAGAPLANFAEDFAQMQETQEMPFPVTAGVLRIFQPLMIPGIEGSVEPGYYTLDYWFEPGGAFIGATISGQTEEEQPVNDQQIPAIPALFLNERNGDETIAQISALKFRRWCCLWQSNCP